MPYPNADYAATNLGFGPRNLTSYLAQLYLRRRLNTIHGELYNPEKPQLDPLNAKPGTATDRLMNWIKGQLTPKSVPELFQWDLNDPPAKDVLSARLRAKYWGAQVIAHRPFIQRILDTNYKYFVESRATPMGDGSNPQNGNPPSPEFSRETIDYAKMGIQALVESTRAFHNVEDKRFVVTNVFGTAHA